MSFILIGTSWFLSSALLSTWANTTYLLYFKDPMLHTFIRFLGSAIIGTITLLLTGEITLNNIPLLVYQLSQPAILLWLANYSNSIALQDAGITLTYVLKAGIPVFTVLVCTLSGQKFPLLIYISLLPICFGVGLACFGDMNFTITGFIAGLVSALSQTFMNISIKTIRNQTGYSGMKSFLGMTILSSLITFPIMLANESIQSNNSITNISNNNINNNNNDDNNNNYNNNSTTLTLSSIEKLIGIFYLFSTNDKWPLTLTLIASLAYYIEYLLNFIFVSYVNNVTFSVCDITRRISIIVIGSFVFNKKLTIMNWIGIIIALCGVLWYTYLENERNNQNNGNVNVNNTNDNDNNGVSIDRNDKKLK